MGELQAQQSLDPWAPGPLGLGLGPSLGLTSDCCSPPGEVRMPSGKVAKPDITDNKDGTVTVKYAPTEAGLHEMDIKYEGIHIPGSLVFCPAASRHQRKLLNLRPETPDSALHRKSPTVLRGLREQWERQRLRSRSDPRDGQQACRLHR